VAGPTLLRRGPGEAGTVAWRAHVGASSDALINNSTPVWTRYSVVEDAWVVVPQADRRVVAYDLASGAIVSETELPGEAHGSPAVFVNELRGGQTRLAVVADQRLLVGAFGEDLEVVPAAGTCMSGPVAHAQGLDRFLLVAGIDGVLRAVDDTTGIVVSELDLRAADISHLRTLDDGGLLVRLDGSRLAVIDGLPDKLRLRWERAAEGGILGPPWSGAAGLLVTQTRQVGWWSLRTGEPSESLALPGGPVAEATPLEGGGLAVAVEDGASGYGVIAIDEQGRIAWQRRTTTAPRYLLAHGGGLLVGMADGSIWNMLP